MIDILTKTDQAWFVAILLLTLPAISLAKVQPLLFGEL